MSHWTDDGSLYVMPGDYDNEDAAQFILDANEAGLEPFHYKGRYFWQGPAVIVRDFSSLRTNVKTQHDNMGLNFVVYPVASARMVSEPPKYPDDNE